VERQSESEREGQRREAEEEVGRDERQRRRWQGQECQKQKG